MLPTVRRTSVSLLAAVLASCGNNPTGASSGGIATSDVVGTWDVSATSLACVNVPVSLVFIGTPGDVEPGGSLTFVSTWSAAATTGALHGTVNVNNRSVVLRLFGPSGNEQVASIEGTIKDTLGTRVLYAQLIDPYAGLTPLFGSATCTSPVSGTRVSTPQ